MNTLPKWGILKYLSVQNSTDVKRPKCPLGTKTTQTDSDRLRCKTKTILYKIWSMIHANKLKRLKDKL